MDILYLGLFIVEVYLIIVAWQAGWGWRAVLPWLFISFLFSIWIVLIIEDEFMKTAVTITTSKDPAVIQSTMEAYANYLRQKHELIFIRYLSQIINIAVLHYMIRKKTPE